MNSLRFAHSVVLYSWLLSILTCTGVNRYTVLRYTVHLPISLTRVTETQRPTPRRFWRRFKVTGGEFLFGELVAPTQDARLRFLFERRLAKSSCPPR